MKQRQILGSIFSVALFSVALFSVGCTCYPGGNGNYGCGPFGCAMPANVGPIDYVDGNTGYNGYSPKIARQCALPCDQVSACDPCAPATCEPMTNEIACNDPCAPTCEQITCKPNGFARQQPIYLGSGIGSGVHLNNFGTGVRVLGEGVLSLAATPFILTGKILTCGGRGYETYSNCGCSNEVYYGDNCYQPHDFANPCNSMQSCSPSPCDISCEPCGSYKMTSSYLAPINSHSGCANCSQGQHGFSTPDQSTTPSTPSYETPVPFQTVPAGTPQSESLPIPENSFEPMTKN
ncbi:MAG: hypothetical protein ACRCUY_11085, partial [Thermoguttaceae bacterium]